MSFFLYYVLTYSDDIRFTLVIADVLTSKYGKPYAESLRNATPGNSTVSEKLMQKLAIQAPKKLIVEKYLIEIAHTYNIEYEPDPQVMSEDSRNIGVLIDLSDKNNLNGGNFAPQPGFIGYPQAPQLPDMPVPPVYNPGSWPPGGNSGGGAGFVAPQPKPFDYGASAAPKPFDYGSASAPATFNYNIPPQAPQNMEKKEINLNQDFILVSLIVVFLCMNVFKFFNIFICLYIFYTI